MHQVIIVGIDFSPGSHAALTEALTLAVSEHTREVHIVHVQSVAAIASAGYVWPISAEQDEILERLHRMAREALVPFPEPPRVFVHTTVGSPTRDLADLAAELGADLIVIGPPAHGLERLFLGSVGARLAHLAGCSLLMVREQECKPERRCLECERMRERSQRKDLWCSAHSGREIYTELEAR
ncbi:MAG: universal stress protein [Polyangiales bacterium]